MELAAGNYCIAAHIWFFQEGSVHSQPFIALNVSALFLTF